MEILVQMYFEIKRKNQAWLHTELITEFCWHCDIECPVLNIDFVLGGFISY